MGKDSRLDAMALTACESIYMAVHVSELAELARNGMPGIAIKFAWEIGQQSYAERTALRLAPPEIAPAQHEQAELPPAKPVRGRPKCSKTRAKKKRKYTKADPADQQRRKPSHLLDHLDLPSIHLGKLRAAGYRTLGQLASADPQELLTIPGFTQAYLNRVGALLADRGLLRAAQ